MNRSSAMRRKLLYLSVLLGMLIPLYLLGQPAGGPSDGGGRLSQMRHQYNMAESDMGEINPTSETMKLALLGMRGVAATLLHQQAHTYDVQHEWDRYKATLNQIALLQPHYDRVWEQQAHNLAYNVAIEFDDYRQRYEMIREGTEYLTRGVRQNTHAPRLIWYSGWFYGHKLGMADEKTQYRRLFSDDTVLHDSLIEQNIAVDSPEARGPLGKPDNWLVGRLWLNYGYELVDSGIQIRRQTPLNFFETGPKWRIKHAEAIEREGILDESAQNAWRMAADDWLRFGNRSIPTTSPFTIKLDQLAELRRRANQRAQTFADLTAAAREQAQQAKLDEFTGAARDLLQRPIDELSDVEKQQRAEFTEMLAPSLDEVLRNVDKSRRIQAFGLIGELKNLNERIVKTEGYRDQINYPFWKSLTLAEQEERTVEARRLVFEAEQANKRAELDQAIELYERAFEIWARIFADYPILAIDQTAEDLYRSIRRYMVAIDSEQLPDDFPLATFARLMGEHGRIDEDQYLEFKAELDATAHARNAAPPSAAGVPESNGAAAEQAPSEQAPDEVESQADPAANAGADPAADPAEANSLPADSQPDSPDESGD